MSNDGTLLHSESETKPPLFDYSIPRWRYIYNATLVVLDLLMTLIATGIMFALLPAQRQAVMNMAPDNQGVTALLALVCASWIISLCCTHTYERHTMGEGYSLYSKLLNAAFVDFIMLCTLGYLFHLSIPRSLNICIPIVSLVLVLVERWLMRRALHRNRRKGEFNYPTIVIGSPEGIHKILRQLRESTSLGYAPIAVCPVASVRNEDDPTEAQYLVSVPFTPANDDEAKLKVLALNSHLPLTAKRLNARTVLIADVLTHDSETTRTLSLAVESMGIELATTASVADISGATLHLRNDPLMPVLTAQLTQYSTFTRILKRVCDIVLSSIAIVLSSPLMLWAAYKVHKEDGGPALYSQSRIGMYGRPFTMYKFRSMRIDADKMDAAVAAQAGVELGTTFKLKEDPRVTKIGHFIRKTSIDEIPQFFNVFKGDMSMVGPAHSASTKWTSTRRSTPPACSSSPASPARGRSPGVVTSRRSSPNLPTSPTSRTGPSPATSQFCSRPSPRCSRGRGRTDSVWAEDASCRGMIRRCDIRHLLALHATCTSCTAMDSPPGYPSSGRIDT